MSWRVSSSRAGFAVEFAEDGDGAFERARELVPDLVVTEILVPGLDGLALCRRLRREPRTAGIRLLVFSVLSAAARAVDAGADAFLRKPLEQRRLVATVEELLALEGYEEAG